MDFNLYQCPVLLTSMGVLEEKPMYLIRKINAQLTQVSEMLEESLGQVE